MNWVCSVKKNLAPPPGALGRGQKVKYLISITKSISKIFIPNFVCVLTNERYKTNQTGFFFVLLPGSCPRGWTWGYLGDKIRFRSAVCPLCYLLLNHLTKFNQIWCVSYSHEWGVQRKKNIWLRLLGPWGGVKYHLISITKSISKIFIPNFVCVLTNERYKTYQTGFSLCSLGHAPGVALWGAGGAQVVKKSNFQTWSCAISNGRG